MNFNYTGKQMSMRMKDFLELIQPLKVRYGYPRGPKDEKALLSYYDSGTSNIKLGISGSQLSEWRRYIITIQTETAEDSLYYTDFIKRGLEGTSMILLSEDRRKDVTVKNGWINTLILNVYNAFGLEQSVYDKDQVELILQEIADRYIFVTSIYNSTITSSFIDKLVVPELEDRYYTATEVIAMKQEYIDKLLSTLTEY